MAEWRLRIETLCRQLHRDKEVMFAGYKFPHPLEYHIFIKVQTMGNKTPREAFDDSLTALIEELGDIRSKFQVWQPCSCAR